jgi:TonB-dependent SusC/RagA subfamily outer membrane receptor
LLIFNYLIENNHFICLCYEKKIYSIIFSSHYELGIMFAQTYVTGKVVDEKGEPVVGATIQIKGGGQGTISNSEGEFSLSAPSNGKLVISYVGMETQELLVQPNMKVVMQESESVLQELVVIGYGAVKKTDVTGSVSTVRGDAISRQIVSNSAQALQGLAPGVNVVANSGAPGGSVTVRIRGIATVLGGAEPLYVVDGMPVNDITYLGNNDIESINILKDASATAIYGARGGNGVILITTNKDDREKM